MHASHNVLVREKFGPLPGGERGLDDQSSYKRCEGDDPYCPRELHIHTGGTMSDERERVECDQNCGAFAKPEEGNLLEIAAAYEHWRDHEYLAGCSHGR